MAAAKMAALRALRARPAPGPHLAQTRGGSGGLRAHLDRYGQHLEAAAGWAERWRLRRLNEYRRSLSDTFGPDAAAAEFTLACGGAVRFSGQPRWLRPRDRAELPHLLHLPLVGIDLSGTPLTCAGLDNLVSLSHLSHLDLSGCPYLSDWALARLHVFGATLQHLALDRCPQVSERGLATLHHLSPGRLRALLEEELPGCEILGLGEP